jgi:deoxyadenosine/deoxycytidine kinase
MKPSDNSRIVFPYRFISVEGNIGAGKTSFCKMIKEEYACNLILEQFDDNPFLPLFYKDPDRFAFTVELFFMTERYKQMEAMVATQSLFSEFTLMDYCFVKTLLFARKNLKDSEYRMFQKLFTTLNQTVPQPDLMVYFHRNIDVLQQNIQKRGRTYETDISNDYLSTIQDAYFEYFRNILSFPVLIIDISDIDFVANRDHYKEIKMLLAKKYRPGVHRISLMV